MKVEKHNAHGMQLVVTLGAPEEALALAAKLVETATKAMKTGSSHYVSLPCAFEDDDDRWHKTDFAVVVEGSALGSACYPAYPCGKPVERMGAIPAGPCDLQAGHEDGCYRRNAEPDYALPFRER